MNYAGTFDFGLFGNPEHDGSVTALPSIAADAARSAGGAIIVDNAQLLFSGAYARHGADLVLSKDGQDHVVFDYFKGSQRKALSTADGATLSPEIVKALVGEVQVAQAGAAAPAAAQTIGTVSKLTGTATAIRNGVSVTLNIGDNVQKGDVVQAGADSSLNLTFIDGTVFGLSANARMVLNEMVYDPQGSANSSLLSLVQGTITFVAGETAHNGNMRVDTPVATMGIRGTAVLVEIGFEVPGQGSAPPVKFQVLVEPGGRVGSYVLYSKSDPTQIIGTVNQAGQVTSVTGAGDTTVALSDPLPPIAQAIIQQTLQQYFPGYVPNANPRSNGPGGGSAPADPTPGSSNPDPIKFTPPTDLPTGQPTTVPVNLPGNGTAPPTTINVTVTPHNSAPTITVAPVEVTLPVNKASFEIKDQVTITDPDTGDVAVPYVAGSAHIVSASGPIGTPTTLDLKALVSIDPQTGHVSYDPAAFKFLAAGQKAVYVISFDSQSGPDTTHQTLTVTIDGSNDAPVVAAPLTAKLGQTDGAHSFNLLAGASDPDLGDTATLTVGQVKFALDGSALPNGAPAGVSLDGTTLHVDPQAFAYLGEGQIATLTVSYTVLDSHGASVAQSETITITGVNDAPVITSASLAVTQGGTTVIHLSDIGISDPDSTTFYYYAQATHGAFEKLVGSDWVAITGTDPVTAADIAAGHIRFHDDGSGIAPDITVVVSDGSAFSAPYQAQVDFTNPDAIFRLTSSDGTYVDVSGHGATNGFAFPGMGNVTTPGTPEDRIVLGYQVGESTRVVNGAPMLGQNGFTTTSHEMATNDDGSHSVITKLDDGHGVSLTQTVTLGADANYFTTTIDLVNGHGHALDDVRFMRNFDPDQDVQSRGSFATNNDVVANPTAAISGLVSTEGPAETHVSSNAIVSATGHTGEVALIGIGADWRASVFGFTNMDPYAASAYDSPVDPNGANADQAITLTYDFGRVEAHGQASVTYLTTANVATDGANALFRNPGSTSPNVDGMKGDDLLFGTAGHDNFVFRAGDGHDTVFNFNHGEDKIELLSVQLPAGDGFNAWLQDHAAAVNGTDTLLTIGQDTILLKNVAHLTANDFITLG